MGQEAPRESSGRDGGRITELEAALVLGNRGERLAGGIRAGARVGPGWWTVYDGNYYYYFFSPDGLVNYIETKPNPKWVPPKTIGNQGKVTLIANGLSILWKPTEPGGQATKEDFTRLNWTSTTEMNGVSSKYSPCTPARCRGTRSPILAGRREPAKCSCCLRGLSFHRGRPSRRECSTVTPVLQ